MTAPALPQPTGTVERISWCPRERRAVARSSHDYDLLAAIRGARARWLRERGSLPRWYPGPGLRTTWPR